MHAQMEKIMMIGYKENYIKNVLELSNCFYDGAALRRGEGSYYIYTAHSGRSVTLYVAD